MDRAGHVFATEHLDRSLDMPPMAEMDDVAERAASVGAVGRLDRRQIAIFGDQCARLREGGAIGNMNMVSQANRPTQNSSV